MTIAVPARAKLNLDLQVIRRRADGYHEIRTRIQQVELHDLLFIEPVDMATSLTVSGLRVDGGDDNSVLKAHAAAEHAAGRKLPARFHLHKRIPPGSGLGGASSDAAAALKGLMSIFKLEVELSRIAADVGSDVPFFINGAAALIEGRGERVTPVPAIEAWFAIAWPAIELSTADVYTAWDEVKGEGLRQAAEHVEPRIRDFARRLGSGWTMTGSGSAFFAQTNTRTEAEGAVEGLGCWTAVTRAIK